MMTAWCTRCGDEFAPVEYVTIPQRPSEPRFCSAECEETYQAAFVD